MKQTLITAVAFAAFATSALANPCGFKDAGSMVVTGYAVGATAVPEPERQKLTKFAETAKHRFGICIFAQVDKQGSKDANRKVAQARAQNVMAYLEQQGVPRKVMKVATQDEAFTFFGLLPDDQAADRRVMVTHD